MERIYVYASYTIPGAVLSVQAPTERCASTVVCAMMGDLASTMGLVAIQSVQDVLGKPHPPPGPRGSVYAHGTPGQPNRGRKPDESPAERWRWGERRSGAAGGAPLEKALAWEGFGLDGRWRMAVDGEADGE